MKVEIEIPDIEELYFSEYEGEEISGKDFKKRIVSIAIEKFIDKMYDDYMNDRVYSTIKDDAKEMVKSQGGKVIVQNGEVVAKLELPIAGLMSNEPAENVIKKSENIVNIIRQFINEQ